MTAPETAPYWLTAFLDLPADRYDAGADYWQRVTGSSLSSSRGEYDEFATLVPPDGDAFLRLQRVGDGPPRVHLDLHVADPRRSAEATTALGARLVADHGDYLTLASPGGFVFCLVDHRAGTRPAPLTWPQGHASCVDQVCLDVPPRLFDAELEFWHAATGWERTGPRPGSEFARVNPPAELALQLLVQRLDDEEESVRAHLDWSSTDRGAEIERHVAAGAEEVATFEGWTVLRDPAGMTYCVTRRTPALARPTES